MTDASPLVVPMTVEAFVVNDWVREGGPFVRSQMQYGALQRAGNGQPGLDGRDLNFGRTNPVPPHNVPASDYYDGVYLKWRLPRAFTHGKQHSAAGRMDFLPIPNRWIVVRFGGPLGARVATAWIVESDYIWPSSEPQPAMTAAQVSSLYVQGAPGTPPTAVYMGRNVPLGSWTEPGTTQKLTAIAPGNPAFAFYQPRNNNVLSFIDVLGSAPAETLSYTVFGWFSAPGDDPLANVAKDGFEKVMGKLGWTLPKDTDTSLSASWSLLAGSVNGVQWQTAEAPPGGAPSSDPAPVSVAAGNTAVEALTAMVTAQAAEAKIEVDAELLEAFQLDMLDVLDEPDGAIQLAEKLHASFFQRFSGGYEWDVVDAPGSDGVADDELGRELQWLAALNQAQAQLDADIRLLASLQAQLYEMWWKYTSWPSAYKGQTVVKGPSGKPLTRDDLLNQLQPSVAGTIAQQVAAQLDKVAEDMTAVPNGATQEALAAAILDYATKHGLPTSRVLKRSAAPSFYAPNNPVVLIAGAGASGIVPDPAATVCRFPSQLVSGFKWDGADVTASTSGIAVPRPDLSGVSGAPWSAALAASLEDEAFFTDPQSAGAISAAIPNSTPEKIAAAMASAPLGIPPAGAVQAWTENPWHPLLLFWQVTYYPIDYGTVGAPNWIFEDGRYVWTGIWNQSETPTSLSGTIQLTPAAAFNMAARLKAFLATSPHLDPHELAELKALLEFIETQDNDWDVLSQALDGFNEQLRLGMAGVFMGPEATAVVTKPSLHDLIGDQDSYPPGLGDVPRRVIPPSNFQPWRAGQFEFVELVVIDEWGQAVWPIDDSSARTETVYLPPDMTPALSSNTVEFIVAAQARVDAVSPALIATGGGDATLTVTGSGFASGATVEWGATALATTFQSAAQLAATVPAALTASAGSTQVTVSSGGSTSNAATVDVSAGPAIGSLSPDLFQAGMATSAEVKLTVDGVGFATGCVVHWDGTPLRTAVRSATELVAAVPANLLATPATAEVTVVSTKGSSPPAAFTISPGAAIGSIAPASAQVGSPALTLAVEGVGFEPGAAVAWNGLPLVTTYVSPTQLTASVPASDVASAGVQAVTEVFGHRVLPHSAATFAQVPPRLLQPARLDFDMLSAIDDSVVFGPSAPGADPICGWVLPNHLDSSLMAYDPAGGALGEMAVGVGISGEPHPCWTPAPGSKYKTLAELAAAIPHFGPFLETLGGQTPATFAAFLAAIDETLWTTVPMGAVFDKSLAVLIGRPLAMVRARVQFELDGPAIPDPSWQYTFTPQPGVLSGYEFAIELGNIAQLDDGLIGYFVEDDYGKFDVVQQSGAASSAYLHPIGVDGNYLRLPFDAKTQTHLSMLVDPRAAVHATTDILPAVSLALPPQFLNDALDAMDVTFRLNGVLTDQQIAAASKEGGPTTTILMPVPDEKVGTWAWVERDADAWPSYPTAPNDATARLSEVPPVLRRGLLQLSAALKKDSSG